MNASTSELNERRMAVRRRVGLLASSPNFPLPLKDVLAKAQIADRLGFASLWLGETWGYELFSSMTAIACTTSQIHIGAGIANTYSRTPTLIASTAATIDELSAGRVRLGLGPSGAAVIEHWHGLPFERPLQRTREYLEIIQSVLSGEKLHYQGKIFTLDKGFKLRFTPYRTQIPLYVAGMGEKMIELTGALADGLLPIYWPFSRFPELRQQLDAASLAAGRPAGSVALAPYLTMGIYPEDAPEALRHKVRQQAAMPLAYYVGRMGTYYADMLARNGYGSEVEAIKAGWQSGLKAAVQAVSPALLADTSLVGTPSEIVARLDELVLSGLDEPIVSMPDGSLEETEALLSSLKTALEAPL